MGLGLLQRKGARGEVQLRRKPAQAVLRDEERAGERRLHAANKLYGISFKERTDLPKYHPDTWIYDVFDKDGKRLSIFIWDPYARPSKRGGAWMNTYVAQSALLGEKPVVANHLNVPKPSEGKPTLLTWDEVTTAFHEFGHALHGFFQDVRYPYFSMNVPRDFVEYPSQVNEMWADWPEILAHYAKHYQTGEAMPKALLDKVIAASKFNQGFATTEYLEAAMLDQRWHQLPLENIPEAGGVMAFSAGAEGRRLRLRAGAAALPHALLQPHHGRLRGRLLRLHLVGGSGRQHHPVDPQERRAQPAERRPPARIRAGTGRPRSRRTKLFPNFAGYEAKIEALLEQRGLDSK